MIPVAIIEIMFIVVLIAAFVVAIIRDARRKK